MRATAEHVEKLVAEKHALAELNLDSLLAAIAANNRDQVIVANRIFLNSLHALGNVVAKEHWPKWLHILIKAANNYESGHANGQATWSAHLNALMLFSHELKHYNWFSQETDSPKFDVDRIINEARKNYKIDELIGRIIETLRALAATGEIDSIKALEDLEEIIRVLKSARTGSFSNQITSWKFAKNFTKNLIKCYLKKSDVVGPFIEAFEETSKELDISFEGASAEIRLKLRTAAEVGFSSEALEATMAQSLPMLPPPHIE